MGMLGCEFMAEFCLNCWNLLNDTQLTPKDVVLSREDDLEPCEHCGRYVRVVVRTKSRGLQTRFSWLAERLRG